MKRTILYLQLLLVIILVFSGCSVDLKPELDQEVSDITAEPVVTEAVTATPEPATATPEPELVQSDKPFGKDDITGPLGWGLSVNDANAMFGEPLNDFAFISMTTGELFVCLDYAAAYIELTGYFDELNGEYYPEILTEMTDSDKDQELNLNKIWIKQDTEGKFKVRGVGFGSSAEQVLAAFLNLSEKYGDGTLYTLPDMNPEWSNDWIYGFAGGRIIQEDAGCRIIKPSGDYVDSEYVHVSPESIEYSFIFDADQELHEPEYDEENETYMYEFHYYGRVRFFIEDNAVIGLEISSYPDGE